VDATAFDSDQANRSSNRCESATHRERKQTLGPCQLTSRLDRGPEHCWHIQLVAPNGASLTSAPAMENVGPVGGKRYQKVRGLGREGH
jgi:hypothetical protein